jgi:hypothetical protein
MNSSDIEYINALAPFDHGVWEGKDSDGDLISVGETALFKDRSEWLVKKIVNYLRENFSDNNLINMKVLEVGSYDGWVITEICKEIDFKEVVGVEPRLKNIKKGEIGRKLANVKVNAEFIQGTAKDLEVLFPEQTFDIVICLGMLHHVSATYDTIQSLCKKSSGLTIIDSMIIPELVNDKALIEPFVNTRDIIYYQEEPIWTVAAYKFESPYGDGSRPDFGLANIPSRKLIEMSLKTCGFDRLEVLGTEEDFDDASLQKLRGVKELLCVAKRDNDLLDQNDQWLKKVSESENIFCNIILPVDIVLGLATNLENDIKNELMSDLHSVINNQITGSSNQETLYREITTVGLNQEREKLLINSVDGVESDHFVILGLIFRSPYEKTLLEISKLFLDKNSPSLAVKYLRKIITKPGCDWWSFYRSCYILRKSFEKTNDTNNVNKYKELLDLSNENFPF